MCTIQDDERAGTHKEAGKARLQRDESEVQRLMVTFKSGLATDPFDTDASKEGDCQPLINIISGVALPQPMAPRLVTSRKIGQEQLKALSRNILTQMNRASGMFYLMCTSRHLHQWPRKLSNQRRIRQLQ